MHKYRSDFANILRASSSNLSKSRFMRLFFLALSMLVCILPLQSYVLYNNIRLSLPWVPYSWSKYHGASWLEIDKRAAHGIVFFDRWTPVASGFMIFIFFGFGRDAARMYRTVFWYLGLGHCFPSIEPPTSSQVTPPAPHVSTSTTLVDSISSRAKSIFVRPKDPGKYLGPLASTRATYNDIEKGAVSTSAHLSRSHSLSQSTVKKSRWTNLPWSLFNRPRVPEDTDGTLLRELSPPSQTVSTVAWASRSDSLELSSGPTSPQHDREFIHVRQVISQQSEIQVQP